jgi:hypothetical protein
VIEVPVYTLERKNNQILTFPGTVSPEAVALKLESMLPSKWVTWKSWVESGHFKGHILCDQETGKEYFSHLITRKSGSEKMDLTVVDRLKS